MISRSSTIQSFWLDPPLVYQGDQIQIFRSEGSDFYLDETTTKTK